MTGKNRSVDTEPIRLRSRSLRVLTAGQRRTGLSELIYTSIKSAIVSCQIPPGTELSERQLAVRYRVTKAPVRSALSKLGQEGWVQSVPRQGHRVANVTLADAQEIFSLRQLLEPAAARLAAGRINPNQILKLNAACSAVDRSDARAIRNVLLAHQRFHVAIAHAAGNVRLAQAIEQLQNEVIRLLYLIIRWEGFSPAWDEGQNDLVNALIANDGESAANFAFNGIRRTGQRILALLERNPEVLEGGST
jgi:DNA-binding GntR family transcriptional regulator